MGDPTGSCVTNSWPDVRSWAAVRAVPEGRPLDVSVVIVIVHLQDAPLQEKRRGAQSETSPHPAAKTLDLFEEPHPSVHRLLHLHGESPCAPVHHRIAQLKEWNALESSRQQVTVGGHQHTC